MAEDLPGVGFRAARLGADGRLRDATPDDVRESIVDGADLVWAHLRVTDRDAASTLLVDRLGFSPLSVEDALSDRERPALHEDDLGLFMVLSAVVKGSPRESYSEVGVFVGANYMVTIATTDAEVVDRWFQRWQARPESVGKNAGELLHAVADAMVDEYFPICDAVEDDVDDLEERIFTGKAEVVGEALRQKRRLLELRRRLTPMREVLNGLLRRDIRFIPAEVKPYLQDVYDHTLRLVEQADINRDILAGVLDAHLAMVSNSLNVAMRVLTVVATFLMTGSLIAGVYGMNFVAMPELKQPWGYPFAIVLMVLAAIGEWFYFRKKGWF